MTKNCEAYAAPEIEILTTIETMAIMASSTGNSSTENLNEENFDW